jgi:hypothetical protein
MDDPALQQQEGQQKGDADSALKLSRKLSRMDSTLAELRSLHRLHSAWVEAGFTVNVGGSDQRVALSSAQSDGAEAADGNDELNLHESLDEDEGGWKFAPSRSTWATGDEDDTTPIASPSNSSKCVRTALMSSGALLHATSSPSAARHVDDDGLCDGDGDDNGDSEEEELELEGEFDGGQARHKTQEAATTTICSALLSPGGGGGGSGSGGASSSPSSSSLSSQSSGEKSPSTQRRRVALLRTKSKSLITGGSRISLSTSFRLPRRQVRTRHTTHKSVDGHSADPRARRCACTQTNSVRDEWAEGEVRSESRKGQYDGTYDSEGSKVQDPLPCETAMLHLHFARSDIITSLPRLPQSGAGRLVYGDGGLYEGEWEKDQRHGTLHAQLTLHSLFCRHRLTILRLLLTRTQALGR